MSLEAIEKVANIEAKNRERKTAAEAEAKQIISNSEKEGLARIQQLRTQSAESGRQLLQKAEEQAGERSAEITRAAQAEGETLRKSAEQYLAEAAEFIVGRVVNH